MTYIEEKYSTNTQSICVIENTFYTLLSLRMELLYFLQEKGYEISVLSTGEKKDREKLESKGFKTYEVGSVIANPIDIIKYRKSLTSIFKTIKPVVVLTFTIRPNIFGTMTASKLNIPVINNITGIGPLQTSRSIFYTLIRLYYRVALRHSACVFFQNTDDRDWFVEMKYVTTEQAKVLPGSGVDTSYYAPREKTKQNTPFTFLMISRLIKDKGVVEFVQAAKRVKTSHPGALFQLLGPFWTQNLGKNTVTKDELQDWVDKKIINYEGYTYDVRPYIGNSDCVVLPSYREGTSNVLMQGASMEKPLIATNVTGCNNIVIDHVDGLLCEPKNAEDLADKMLEMMTLSQNDRKEMGKNGRKRMQEYFEKQIVLDAYLSEIKRLTTSN